MSVCSVGEGGEGLSIGARASIVATVITVLFVPVMSKGGKVNGHGMRKGSVHTLRCVQGKPIKATPLAKRLGLVGKPCKKRIVRSVQVKPRP